MANKRNLSGLEKNRGKRPKLNHMPFTIRSTEAVKAVLGEIAIAYGCVHNEKPSLSNLLQRIADGELTVLPAPAPAPDEEIVLSIRVSPEARAKLTEIAAKYDLRIGKGKVPKISRLLEEIALGTLSVTPAASPSIFGK